MSWGFTGVGTPKALADAIEKACQGYTEGSQSRVEFEQAKPCLQVLVSGVPDDTVVSVSASGHKYFENDKLTSGNIDVSIKTLGKIYN